jgi:hypothetical protein
LGLYVVFNVALYAVEGLGKNDSTTSDVHIVCVGGSCNDLL